MAKLFGTDGIRGKAGEYPVTDRIAERLGAAIVKVLGLGHRIEVLIGRDTRESGLGLEAAMIRGLLACGASVIRLGVMPTPALAYLVRRLGANAAVMITASHNPFEDNGMKIFDSKGYKLDDRLEEEIEALLTDPCEWIQPSFGGEVRDLKDGSEIYAQMAKSCVNGLSLRGMKLVLDAGNGAAYRIAPRIFRDLGADVITMANCPNGKNINEDCGAMHPERAGQMVRKQGAHLGISLDGDADRVIFCDAEGSILNGDRLMTLIALGLHAKGLLKNRGMVATVMSNLGLDEALGNHGIKVIRAGVGDRHVSDMMRVNDYHFGGENSGHLIFSDYATTGDGIMSALQVCRLMREEGKSLSELAAIMEEYPSALLNLPVREKPPIETLKELPVRMREADLAFGKKGRQLIRYSGTESKIRVLVEHKDAAMVNEWIEKFKITITKELG
jgi:phosphoglucosamine mutase